MSSDNLIQMASETLDVRMVMIITKTTLIMYCNNYIGFYLGLVYDKIKPGTINQYKSVLF